MGDVEINHNSEVTGCNAQLEDQVLTSEVRARSELSLEIPFIFNTGSMSLDHTGGFYASTGFAVDFLLSLIGLPGLTAFGIIDFEVELIEQRIEIPFQLRAALELGVGGPRRGVAQAELGMRIAAHHEANPVVSGDFDMLMIAFYIPFTGDAELNSEMSFNLDAKAKVSLGTNGVETQAYSSFEYFVFAELSPVRACALGVFCFEAADRQILIDQRPAPTFAGEDFEFGFDLTEADRNGE